MKAGRGTTTAARAVPLRRVFGGVAGSRAAEVQWDNTKACALTYDGLYVDASHCSGVTCAAQIAVPPAGGTSTWEWQQKAACVCATPMTCVFPHSRPPSLPAASYTSPGGGGGGGGKDGKGDGRGGKGGRGGGAGGRKGGGGGRGGGKDGKGKGGKAKGGGKGKQLTGITKPGKGRALSSPGWTVSQIARGKPFPVSDPRWCEVTASGIASGFYAYDREHAAQVVALSSERAALYGGERDEVISSLPLGHAWRRLSLPTSLARSGWGAQATR